MYKAKSSCGLLVKSFKIEDLFNFLIETKGSEYQFFIGYAPISYNDFSKLYLTETSSAEQYILIESLLNPRIDLIDYEKTRNESKLQ